MSVEQWTRSLRLRSGISPFEIVDEQPDTFGLRWRGLDRLGAAQTYRASVDRWTGELIADRPLANWSDRLEKVSRVIVAPDMPSFWRLVEAIGDSSVYPFVLVASTASRSAPHEWLDPRYWRFEQLILLFDSVTTPSPLLPILSKEVKAGVALPPANATWRDWAAANVVDYAALDRISRAAKSIDDHRGITVQQRGGSFDAITSRRLDDEMRLARTVFVEPGRGTGSLRMLIRSDRSAAEIVHACGTRTVAQAAAPDDAVWSMSSVESFLSGDSRKPRDLGERLRKAVVPLLKYHADARSVVAFVGLTYIFAAFDRLPILVLRGGSSSGRLAVRRMLSAICHSPVSIARARAARLARVADAGGGVMLLDEPGPLAGPHGPTEVGRFLEAGCVRDASTYVVVTGRDGLRSLDIYGPKAVIGARIAGSGLGCRVEEVELSDATPCDFLPSEAGALRDDLYLWSMNLMEELGGGWRKAGVPDALAFAEEQMFAEAESPILPAPQERSDPLRPSPEEVMRKVLVACGNGGHLAMVQVLLEVALHGGDPEALTPERVGRWLAIQPEVDAGAMTRRRLHGQISRIYKLNSGDTPVSDDPAAAFAFCVEKPCAECRYSEVCGAIFPGMHARKARG
ncbi:hypothetical protein [Sphingomonas morindae]|uniref:Uncharacterized protein n=1 Tax=Sphingomonas morindae TaxID=1541170 RepID=A0ABY4XAS9_9SPHN|nr:hypothetical protein [Sphingomonas morindae]USI73939.1 hypothetical protein LHA26_05590 [Sphingomonas morindae]